MSSAANAERADRRAARAIGDPLSKLVHAAGWVPAHSVPGDLTGTRCAFCGGLIDYRGGWVNIAAEAFACPDCLPDPDVAERVGEDGDIRIAGREAANRLVERARKRWRNWPL